MFGNKEPQEDDEAPEEDPEEDPESSPTGTGGFDISSLLQSLMGGDSKANYQLTPPLVINEGETLVFSAKKGKSDDGRRDTAA